MKTLGSAILVLALVITFSSVCMAQDLSKAYSLYYQGKMKEAIKIMEDYVAERPDARVLYFIGYSYYELKNWKMARKYFEEAYLIDPNFTPIPERMPAEAK
jgi:tetratricopeptide (TPR) repeat protein